MTMYLIQRLILRRPARPRYGFDGLFALDYMGSSEFEWGAPHEALKAMRAGGPVLTESGVFALDGVENDVHFVGRPSTFARAVDAWSDWFHDPKRRNKENPGFHAEFNRTHDQARYDAWWSFDDDLAWALDSAVAAALVTAFDGGTP